MRTPWNLRTRALVELALAVGLAALFLYTADEVLENEWTVADSWVLLTIHRLASPAGTAVMRTFTFIGSGAGLVPLALVTVAWCVQRGERRQAAWLVAVAIVAAASNLALKLAFARARPSLWEGALHLETYSFPSGHAMSSAATLGMVAVVAARLAPRFRTALALVTPVIVLGVGLSRMYLGAHWPSDVLGGWAAGSLVLLGGVVASRGK